MTPSVAQACADIASDPNHELIVGEWAGEVAATLQLTTDKRRTDACRFCARLGFVASHEGMKLELPT